MMQYQDIFQWITLNRVVYLSGMPSQSDVQLVGKDIDFKPDLIALLFHFSLLFYLS